MNTAISVPSNDDNCCERNRVLRAKQCTDVDAYICLDRYCSLSLFKIYFHSVIVREDMISESYSNTEKGKAVPLQAWSGPEGSRKLRFPDYMTTAQDAGKFVSLTHRPPLPPGNAPGTHFC
jgi:hypothetical protein